MEIKPDNAAPSEEILDLSRQIMANCHRSDARYAGHFSLCGLLLRLRDYYKWDRGLQPWADVESADTLAWIEERENYWEELGNGEVLPLHWRGRALDPFDTESLNRDLAGQGWYYGAGLAAFMKPSFFLGRILQQKHIGDFQVTHIGGELARDLFTAPAMTRGEEIVSRRRPLAAWLWDAVLHAGNRRRRAMSLALSVYGLDRKDLEGPEETWAPRLKAMLDREAEPFVRHEYGEAVDRRFPRDEWRLLVGGHPRGRIELMARSVKDLLADTGEEGRLSFIVENRRLASLAIYVGLLDGLPELLFPEIIPAMERLLTEKDWGVIEEARRAGLARGGEMAQTMLTLAEKHAGDEESFARGVEEACYRPLGL